MRSHLLLFAFGISTNLVPLTALAQPPSPGAIPALYATKAEAEKAAKLFHCTGAHPMGDKWMPCERHGDAHSH